MVLYVLVGFLSLSVMFIFAVYHRLVARPPSHSQPIAAFKFSSFFMLTIPPAATGSVMGMLPVLIADVFIAVAIVGDIFFLETAIFECTMAEGAVVCPLTFLDLIKPDPYAITTNYVVVRTGRCGVALLATGLYLMRAGMVILIPDKTDYRKVIEAYDGNTWEYFTWKRINMVYVSTFLLFFCLAIIQFSFSELFGEQIWVSIAVLKLMAIVVDELLAGAMDEDLLTAPLSMVVIVVLGLVTFGADDFLDFLTAFFIELGIMIFERTYFGQVVTAAQQYADDKLPELKKTLQHWLEAEDDGLDEEEEKLQQALRAEDGQK